MPVGFVPSYDRETLKSTKWTRVDNYPWIENEQVILNKFLNESDVTTDDSIIIKFRSST